MIVSGFRAALDLDTYPLSNLIRQRCAERAKPSRGKPVLIMHIGFFACISLERVVSVKWPHYFSSKTLDTGSDDTEVPINVYNQILRRKGDITIITETKKKVNQTH